MNVKLIKTNELIKVENIIVNCNGDCLKFMCDNGEIYPEYEVSLSLGDICSVIECSNAIASINKRNRKEKLKDYIFYLNTNID